jgi:hypothetical protein
MSTSASAFRIRNSSATGNVTGVNYVGGISGYSYSYFDNVSYTGGTVTGNNYVGGILGWAYAIFRLQNSYTIANINGQNYVGGLIGRYEFGSLTQTSIKNCYSMSTVTGSSYIGGLIGRTKNKVNVVNSYADDISITGSSYIGGIIGGKETSNTEVKFTSPIANCQELGNENTIDNSNYVCSDVDMQTINITWDADIWNNLGVSTAPTLK